MVWWLRSHGPAVEVLEPLAVWRTICGAGGLLFGGAGMIFRLLLLRLLAGGRHDHP